MARKEEGAIGRKTNKREKKRKRKREREKKHFVR